MEKKIIIRHLIEEKKQLSTHLGKNQQIAIK